MRGVRGIAAAVALAVTGLSTAAPPVGAKTLTFLTESLPPFNYGSREDVQGPSRAIISAVCGQIEADCRFELLPKKRMMRRAREGRADGLFSLGKNAERMEWMYFSRPLLRTAYGFFVPKGDDLRYRAPADLAGYRVVTYGPSNMAKSLRGLVEAEQPGVADITIDTELRLSFRKLAGGRYGDTAAVYSNRDVGRYILQDEGIDGVRYAGEQRGLHYYVGFPKKAVSRALVRRFNDALVGLHKSGRLAEILGDYGLQPPKAARMRRGEGSS